MDVKGVFEKIFNLKISDVVNAAGLLYTREKKGYEYMNELQNKAIDCIRQIPENKLHRAIYFLTELAKGSDAEDPYETEGGYPLDDFDYSLARQADEDDDMQTFAFDEVLEGAGLTYDDMLQKV